MLCYVILEDGVPGVLDLTRHPRPTIHEVNLSPICARFELL